MSENNIQNEQELWDTLREPVTTGSKPEPARKREVRPEPVKESAKEGRKLDGFFFACMAGVAAVSVAATLVLGGMLGPKDPAPGAAAPVGTTAPAEMDPADTTAPAAGDSEALEALELENAELRAQLELQKQQIKDLQAQLLDLSDGSDQMPTLSTEPGTDSELVSEQLQAYEIFNQIKDAYADFDRETLEELIPEMDKRLSYLSPEALNTYYTILEYVEQPSNG